MIQEAPTVPCARCGAALPVDPAAASARCAHCGEVTPVPEAMRAEARAFLRAIAAERGKASFAQRIGRGFGDAEALTSAGARLFPLLLVLAGLLTAGQMAPSFLAVSGDVRAWSLVAFMAGLGLALLWFFWSLARAVDRAGAASEPPPAPAAPEPEGSVRSACSSCGAPVTFVGILVLAVGIGLLVSYLSRPRAIGRALAELRAHTRGRVSAGGVIPALDWLDAHWAGPAPEAVVSSAASDDGAPVQRWTLDFSHGGRPAMVVAAHAPHVRRIDVFLAAYRRREASASMAGPEVGFFSEVNQAGVHVWQEDSDPSVLRPERIDRALASAARMT